jgi:hypothetical protein
MIKNIKFSGCSKRFCPNLVKILSKSRPISRKHQKHPENMFQNPENTKNILKTCSKILKTPKISPKP